MPPKYLRLVDTKSLAKLPLQRETEYNKWIPCFVNLPTLTFVPEHIDSNAALPLPKERLEDMWLSLPQHDGGGVIARCPPAAPQQKIYISHKHKEWCSVTSSDQLSGTVKYKEWYKVLDSRHCKYSVAKQICRYVEPAEMQCPSESQRFSKMQPLNSEFWKSVRRILKVTLLIPAPHKQQHSHSQYWLCPLRPPCFCPVPKVLKSQQNVSFNRKFGEEHQAVNGGIIRTSGDL